MQNNILYLSSSSLMRMINIFHETLYEYYKNKPKLN
ncbi:TPA: hypothetical protein J1325_004600 [Escherichia coli]|nr:hypothetical protein [Escherichia coli]EJA1155112.1 hypothetical protein [Escherichia coli]MBC0282022.1 hypothetical protein [Escherichia coli]HBA7787091.1 hypothetical protein [Escherichia coli]HBA9241886.1 hypothetical protein [Escherichia coli]